MGFIVVMPKTRIWEVLGSNFCQDTCCHNYDGPSALARKCQYISGQKRLLPNYLQFIYDPTIQWYIVKVFTVIKITHNRNIQITRIQNVGEIISRSLPLTYSILRYFHIAAFHSMGPGCINEFRKYSIPCIKRFLLYSLAFRHQAKTPWYPWTEKRGGL